MAARSRCAAAAPARATSSSTRSGRSKRTGFTRRRGASTWRATCSGARGVRVRPELDTFRLDNLWDLDVRASKVFRLERMNIEAIADLFNVMNANTELVRNRNAGSTTFNQLV